MVEGASGVTPGSSDNDIGRRACLTAQLAQTQLGAHLPDQWRPQVLEIPALHCGLGIGTQLAASVAVATEIALRLTLNTHGTGMLRASEPPTQCDSVWHHVDATAQHLAYISGRGKRSAIGLYGFLHGGLIQDLGYVGHAAPGDGLDKTGSVTPRSVTAQATGFPEDWPIVLILGSATSRMHGAAEETLITAAGSRRNVDRDEMIGLSETCMRGADQRNFECFVSALEIYMRLASKLFESVQLGRYSNAHIASTVARATEAGLRGVGQSSWGPTVFGFASHIEQATNAAQRLRQVLDPHSSQVLIVSASNRRRTVASTQLAACMPANLTPQYHKAEAAFRQAQTTQEELECLQVMLRRDSQTQGDGQAAGGS